jgi:hypothetical protein
MTPLVFFCLITTATVTATIGSHLAAIARHRRLNRLARLWRMHYTRHDRLRLADRVAASFPIPGAADVRVVDLFFRTAAGEHEYIFTVEYTLGLIHNKRRWRRAAACAEPVHAGSEGPLNVRLAPEQLSVANQYDYFHASAVDPAVASAGAVGSRAAADHR